MAVGAEAIFGNSIVTTKLNSAISWARESSMWPYVFGTACCAIEFMSAASSKFDISRFGAEVVRFSPRQADLMVVAGTISHKQVPVLRKIYNQMTEPKWVISMGACACSGGFYDNYTTLQGIDSIIPVDVYVAGCPPRPEALLDALLQIQKLQKKEESIIKDRVNKNFKGQLDV
ncbi:MAG: NADH-quinone oxidoreductase subunit NuoB [Sulfurospirillum sp.]|nr:NADH-quinone oxidoreductase subunit NuoB [Sulfurospirillum sp.]MBL0702604.1 NADH-quinone oxidoreductase subunit NuoB [Sulfurospirillum sp.]